MQFNGEPELQTGVQNPTESIEIAVVKIDSALIAGSGKHGYYLRRSRPISTGAAIPQEGSPLMVADMA